MLDPDLAAYVRASLPPPPARVLEIGAGRGELAAHLVGAGYDVTAIDPAYASDLVRQLHLHELDEPPASFDAAVAVVSLHHLEPLAASCERLARLLRPGAALVIDEFDVERFDERAAIWWQGQRVETTTTRIRRRPSSLSCATTSTLSRRCAPRSRARSRSASPSAGPTSTAGTCRPACAPARST